MEAIQVEIINHLIYLQTNYHALNPVERKLAVDKLRELRDKLQRAENEASGKVNEIVVLKD